MFSLYRKHQQFTAASFNSLKHTRKKQISGLTVKYVILNLP